MCSISRAGPIVSLLLLLVLGCIVDGCGASKSKIEVILSRYKAGYEETPLIKELNLTGQPCFYYPNLPAGEEMVDYFLPEGTVRVSTKVGGSGKVVLSSDPFFIEDRTPVADRVKKYNDGMEDYAKAHRLPIKAP